MESELGVRAQADGYIRDQVIHVIVGVWSIGLGGKGVFVFVKLRFILAIGDWLGLPRIGDCRVAKRLVFCFAMFECGCG
jgi:hypothetical protein